ncbi:MAG: phosphotransferase family protein [Sporichthyaceae bacterium]
MVDPARPPAARHALVPDATKALPDDAWIAQLRADFPAEAALDDVLVRKLQRRGRDTHTRVDFAALGKKLEAFLAARVDGELTVSDLAPLAGGASKEQFSFRLNWDDGTGRRDDRMVLRMSPPASVVETSRLQEFQMLRAVQDTLPVPHCYWATEDLADFGEPAIISGFVTGVAAPTGGTTAASGIGTGYTAELRPTLATQFIAHLAALHTIDPTGKDLSSFDLPEVGTTQGAEAMCNRWFRVWIEDALEEHPTMALARWWLWENLPVLDHLSLLHGDYRNGNFLFDEASGQITSLLDWELATVGDRHLDLAYALLPMWGHDDESGIFVSAGLMEKNAFIAEYERASGLTVNLATLRWYSVLNLYWATVACYGSGVRAAQANMTHLQVMMGFVAGLAAECVHTTNEILQEA